MLQQLSFYIAHSLNDLRVNGRRTFFALLCIAAGVAAVVSLQTLAVMIADTLNGNLQAANRGDLQFKIPQDAEDSVMQKGVQSGVLQSAETTFFGQTQTYYTMTPDGFKQLAAWFEKTYPGQATLTDSIDIAGPGGAFGGTGVGVALTAKSSGAQASQVQPILIDPKVYPFYAHIESITGQPLADLIKAPTDLLLDQKAASKLNAKVGDVLRPNGSTTDFTVRGIVPTAAEITDPINGILASLFGFYYMDASAAQYFTSATPTIDTVYVQLREPSTVAAVTTSFKAAFPFLQTKTTLDLAEQNKSVTDQVSQLLTIMGLVSLLLGSIGIINTMQVVVRRRTVEIAVLKTLGLGANQITLLFLVEAIIMGIIGSVLGIVLGWTTTLIVKGVAQNLVAQTLIFRLAPVPALNGLLVGTLITTIFGFLPTLAAGQVRPGLVLHPTGGAMPRAGLLRTLGALLVIIIALALVANTILGSFGLAIAVTLGAFISAGLLLVLLSFLIWIIGRFLPGFGVIDLHIARRQMLATRGRGAITLLALVVGVFSLSVITLSADAVNGLLKYALNQYNGNNVIIALGLQNTLGNVEKLLTTTEGVHSYQVQRSYQGTFVSLAQADGTTVDTDRLKARFRADSTFQQQEKLANTGNNKKIDLAQVQLDSLGTLTGQAAGQPSSAALISGRALTPADVGKAVIVVSDTATIKEAKVHIGDKLTYRFGKNNDSPTATFEVVGIEQSSIFGGGLGVGIKFPYDALPAGVSPTSVQIWADVADANLPALRRQLSAIPGAFIIETSFLTQLFTTLLGTFTAFPTMIAVLGLIVGGVVIANSVALTTLERQREIAVMKAIGVQRERVLGMLLIENALLGLIGGLIGVGLGVAGVILLLSAGGTPVLAQNVPYGSALLLMLLCIGIALTAAATTAWGASGEKPLKVLRSE